MLAWLHDHERLFEFTLVGFAALVLAILPALPAIPLCPILIMTGSPCPFCGTTRSLWSILHLRFEDAWQFHPVGYVILLMVARRFSLDAFRNIDALRAIPAIQLLERRPVEHTLIALFFASGTLRFLGFV